MMLESFLAARLRQHSLAISYIATILLLSLSGRWSGTCFADELLRLPELRTDAQTERDGELLYLKEEQVSIAARHAQPISQAPSNVYVITDQDIRQSGATDLPTILRRIPGLDVVQMTGADFNVSVRGNNQLNANKLLVMVDGRSIYVDVQGSVFWKALPVTLPEIKRIEVQKGPASVLYGFNAFDGIINIITKSPDEMQGVTAQFGGGAYGTISSAAIYANKMNQFSYRLSYGHDQTQQWRNGSALAYRDNKFNVQTEYALGPDSKVMLSGGLVDANQFDGFVNSVAVHTGVPTLGYAHASYDRSNFLLRAYWNSFNSSGPVTIHPLLAPFLRASDQSGNSDSILQGHTHNIEAQQGIDLGATVRAVTGINYRHNTLSHNFLDRFRTEDRLGIYLQGEWKPTPMLKVVGGARYDLDTFINPTISPRGSLLFMPVPDHTFRVTVAVGYRPPTLYETYSNSVSTITLPPPIPSPPPFSVLGSGSLHPEKIVSYDVEYQGWYLQHRLRTRASLFWNHISDLITHNRVTYVQTEGVADIYGGEAGMEFLATKWLSGFWNGAYQETAQSLTEISRRGGPRYKWNVGLRGQWEQGVSGEIGYHFVGATTYLPSPAFSEFAPFGVVQPNPRVGSYHLLNLRGAYRFWQETMADGYRREAEAAISVFNALNDKHREHPLGDMIGSRVMGWLTVRY